MTSGSSTWDAVVVGSGPAGATAALHLASKNLRVLILEKQPWPRYKTCGGGLVWRARRHLEVAIEDSIEEVTHRAELHLHDSAATFSVTRDLPLVSMTMRSILDSTLAAAAVQAGAEMKADCRVDQIARQSDCLVVVAAGETFRGRYLVAADGATGSTAALTGWTAQPRLIPALESEIQVDRATLERFSDVARFDFSLVPAGYGWVFPKRDCLSVGCLSRRRQPDLRRHLETYLERLEIRPTAREDHGFVIPIAPRARLLAKDRVLLTGDSAGLADPVTGEGISNALVSGRLAAMAITDCGPDPKTVTNSYQRSLESCVLNELRYARILARLLYETPRLRGFAFRHLGQTLSETMADIISGDLTYRGLLRRPSPYLHAAKRIVIGLATYPKG